MWAGGDEGVAHAAGGSKGMALAPAAARAAVAGAQLAGSIAEEALENAVFDQHGALGLHAFVVHGKGAEGAIAEAFIDGRDGFVGNGLADHFGKGGGAPLYLGGFQQVAAGLMKNHAAEAVGQHRWHLTGFDVIGVEHGAHTRAHVLGGGVRVPLAQVIGAIGGAVAAAEAGAVVAVGGKHV